MNISVSSVAFKDTEAAIIFLKMNSDIYLELGVNLKSSDVDTLVNHGVKSFSIHVPSPNLGYFPNFASFSDKVINKSYTILDHSVKTAVDTGAKVMVLHAGYADEVLLPSLFKERKPYLEQLMESFQRYVLVKDGAVSNKSYTDSPIYNKYLKNVIDNLKVVNKYLERQGIVLAVENLNPRILYLFQKPTDFIALTKEIPHIHICLDVGHLWISSQVNQFNFYNGLEKMLATGRVVTCHLHNNHSSGDKGFYSDEHNHLLDGCIDMGRMLKLLEQFDVPNATIEVKEDPSQDLEYIRKRIGIKT